MCNYSSECKEETRIRTCHVCNKTICASCAEKLGELFEIEHQEGQTAIGYQLEDDQKIEAPVASDSYSVDDDEKLAEFTRRFMEQQEAYSQTDYAKFRQLSNHPSHSFSIMKCEYKNCDQSVCGDCRAEAYMCDDCVVIACNDHVSTHHKDGLITRCARCLLIHNQWNANV